MGASHSARHRRQGAAVPAYEPPTVMTAGTLPHAPPQPGQYGSGPAYPQAPGERADRPVQTKIRNLVNLHKPSLALVDAAASRGARDPRPAAREPEDAPITKPEDAPITKPGGPRAACPSGGGLGVAFTFDAAEPCSVTVFYMAAEDEARGSALRPEAQDPGPRVMYPAGLGQAFPPSAPQGGGMPPVPMLELERHTAQELERDDGEVFPVVIRLEAVPPGNESQGSLASLEPGCPCPDWVQSQTTYARFAKGADGRYVLKIMKQKLRVQGTSYELQEIYGLSERADADAESPECVICLEGARTTMVLPCRHLCMCKSCAQQLSTSSQRCPICRLPMEKLVSLKLPETASNG